ncbi:MAG: PIN domain-containing protein [Candidatus Woesearchaeota archaeon]
MVLLEDFRSEKSVILDTCFIIYELKLQKENRLLDFCNNNKVILISFTLDELNHVSKNMGHDKRLIRDFLKRARLNIVDVPVRPGDFLGERNFVSSFSSDLLKLIHDPSDAVLVVAAIKSGSSILTRDKHHLFTSVLSEELSNYNVGVFNDISTYVNSC